MPTRTTEEQQKGTAPAPAKRATQPKGNNVQVDEGKASVSYTISITKNLGDYESLKIQAGITIPYGASDEMLAELDELMVVAKERVVTRLENDVTDITDNLSK